MSLYIHVKNGMTSAMKSGQNAERDTYRLVLGELQRVDLNGKNTSDPSDEQVVKVLKKIIENNKETLKVCPAHDPRFNKLNAEITLLSELIPKQWDSAMIEAFFLNHNDPIFEQIRDGKTEGAATGIAMKALKVVNAPVDGKVVGEVVRKIRSS